jgi:exopolyphosphatase/guanosine-5'-triphosphate,3'-diphosphate pyrophosphatase
VNVAVVDIGTNSTRLLIAHVRDGAVTELDRRSVVTRLGEGVDRTGRLSAPAQARVLRVLDEYAGAIAAHGCERRVAVLTSAVRDAGNGPSFQRDVAQAAGLDARVLTGDEEAALTFRGASAGRDDEDLLVIDIGGGSTELVTGSYGRVRAHVSTQNGVVRHSERHLHDDPPAPAQLASLARDVRANLKGSEPFEFAGERAVAVAGTATQCAAMDLALEPYDAARVEGHVLTAEVLRGLLDRTAAVPLAQRREIRGLHADRAPVIVAGIVILLEVLDFFGLDRVAASEHDILWGAALAACIVR